ncbi:MAG: TlpA family protein disulfide reductase [Candidatus Promineifilaceae bacterium]
MKISRFAWAVLIIIVLLAGTAWIAYSQVPPDQETPAKASTEAPIPGHRAPTFTLETTTEETVSLADFAGKPVVLNFWATWCPPCRAEIPHFQDTSLKYDGLAVILGIDQGEPLPIVADFAASFGVTYPLLLDSNSDVNRQYNVSALPTTIFIDADGVVSEVYSGMINSAVLEDRIEKMLLES